MCHIRRSGRCLDRGPSAGVPEPYRKGDSPLFLGHAPDEHPWPSFLHITNFAHPITARLPQDLFWDNQSHVGPQFHVADQDAVVLGEVVMAQGTCQPGFAVKSFPSWRSIYAAVPNVPSTVLREIARFANVHLYNEAGDVLAVSRTIRRTAGRSPSPNCWGINRVYSIT